MASNTVVEDPADKSALIPQAERIRALIGSAVGSVVEWYDFFLYGTMSALVFGPLFFPSDDPVVSQLLALTAFALSFLVRPIGGIVFSHMGDRIGRKKTLVITLTMMGAATVGIGLLPTYASVGVLAPILLTLLRFTQAFSLGGEWGGGLLMAVEYSPSKRRGFYGAIPQTGALFGLALGNLAASSTTSIFSEEDFLSFGWRIPFLVSVVLIALGLWVRSAVDETPSFRAVLASRKTERLPIAAIFRNNWREVLIVIGAKAIETATFFLFATYTVSHMVGLGYTRTDALNAVLIAAVLAIPVMLGIGALSDRTSRKMIYGIGTVLAMIFVLPYFWMLEQGTWGMAVLALVIGFSVIWSFYGATLGSYFAESFPGSVRYTGVSLGYQVGAALFGGPLPAIATALVAAYASYLPVGLLVIGFGVLSLIAVAFTKDRTGQPLDD
ncbi:MAG: MHS family MFS transporter [Propionibacteriaceae bacterium]|nr:MHS family MFS transporter [Propionibacteriaceae bacterium]